MGPFAVKEIESDFFFPHKGSRFNGLGTLFDPHQSKFGLSGYFRIRKDGRMKMYCTVYFKTLGEFKDCCKDDF